MMRKSIGLLATMCFFIGFGIVSQAGVTEGQSVYVSAKAIGEYQTSIESEQQEIQNIEARIQDVRDEIAIYEAAQHEDDYAAILERLITEATKQKMLSGYETVQGPGVKIIIDDGTRPLLEGESINNLLVHDIDILMVVNDLRRCGAEAISVNGQRIVGTTSISCSGYTIRINDQVYAKPFVIRAIGDGKRISASLISAEGYGTYLKNYGVQFSVELADEIVIPGYSGGFYYQYMTNTKEV